MMNLRDKNRLSMSLKQCVRNGAIYSPFGLSGRMQNNMTANSKVKGDLIHGTKPKTGQKATKKS